MLDLCRQCGEPITGVARTDKEYCSNACKQRRYRTWDKHQQTHLERNLWRKYGITIAELHELREAHEYACAICRRRARLVVDHDHKTGKIRGLLCHKCNIRVGLVERVEPMYDKIQAYLRPHRA